MRYCMNRLNEEQLQKIDELLDELDESRMIWLSGYLEGRIAGKGMQTVQKPEKSTGKILARLAILYGTETGNCLLLAEKLAQKATFKNIDARVYNLYEYDPVELQGEENIAVIVSTHGDGDMPEMAEDFYKYISGENAANMENVSFSVLALGDKTYKHFCVAGELIHNALKDLGAFNIVPLEKCDVDYEQKAEIWMNNFLMNITPSVVGDGDFAGEDNEPREFNKNNPFPAKVLKKTRLSGAGSDKEVYHLELSLEGSGLSYEPGDAVGIFTVNPERLIEQILTHTGLDEGQNVFVKVGQVTLKEALTNHVEITVLTYSLIKSYHEITQIDGLDQLLNNDDLLEKYIHGRDLLDLLVDFPFEWNANKLVQILRPLPPRLYSISSSQEKVGEQVHATISLIKFEKVERERLGACSSQIAYLLEEGRTVPIYIDKNPSFKLPEDNSAIIMVGTGTGIAPYRSFMQHRGSLGYKGYSWLFYGDRRFDSDFLYKEEWESMVEDESLERIDVAFSRDQAEKVYVQHKLIENQSEVFEWIENGAHFYLCGDMKKMAKDVNKTLLEIIQTQGGVDEEQARQYLKMLKREKRYQTDVY